MPPVEQNILQALRSPDEENRKRAIFLAAQTLEFRTIPALNAIANEDPSIELRYFAKKALFFLQQNYLRRQKGEGTGEIPAPAVQADAGQNERVEALRRELANPSAEVRNKVLQALVRLGGPRALEALVERAGAEEDPFVRATLAISLGILGGRAQLPLLETFLQDQNPRVRANAIEGLMHLDAPEAARLIAPHLKDTDNRVKVNAYTALGKFDKVDLLRAMAEMLSSAKVWMRDSATYALVKLELPESVPLLEHALQDPYKGIRLKARNGLVLLARKNVKPALDVLEKFGGARESPEAFLTLEFLDAVAPAAGAGAADAQARMDAVLRIVAQRDRTKVDELLAQVAAERDARVLATLLLALGRLGDRRALGALAGHLRHEDRRVRANAVEALGLLGGEEVHRLIRPFLEDPDNRVRANAVVALGGAAGVDLGPTLQGMMGSAEELMRLSAVYALLVLRRPASVPLLEGLVGDPVPRVRKKAIDSLRILVSEGVAAAAEALSRAGVAPA